MLVLMILLPIAGGLILALNCSRRDLFTSEHTVSRPWQNARFPFTITTSGTCSFVVQKEEQHCENERADAFSMSQIATSMKISFSVSFRRIQNCSPKPFFSLRIWVSGNKSKHVESCFRCTKTSAEWEKICEQGEAGSVFGQSSKRPEGKIEQLKTPCGITALRENRKKKKFSSRHKNNFFFPLLPLQIKWINFREANLAKGRICERLTPPSRVQLSFRSWEWVSSKKIVFLPRQAKKKEEVKVCEIVCVWQYSNCSEA